TEYVSELEDRVIDYARNNADELFSEKVKTYQCEGGAISSRKQPEQVGFVNADDDDESVATRIIEQADLLPEFDRLRAEFANVFPFLRIRLSLDRQGMVAAFRDRTLL